MFLKKLFGAHRNETLDDAKARSTVYYRQDESEVQGYS